jgi:VanZ family protein
MSPEHNARTVLGALSFSVTLGILICTLWPLDPFPRNKVSWLPGTNGIRFDWAGVVLSAQPLACGEKSALKGSASLEIWLKPSETQSVYTVLDFFGSGSPFRFRLRQYRDGLIVSRESRVADGRLERAKIDLDHGLQAGKLTLVTLTSTDKGTTLYLDGAVKQTYPKFRIAASDLSGQVVLGTAPVDSQPWIGEIHGLAVYDVELTPTVVQEHFLQGDKLDRPTNAEHLDAVASYTFSEGQGNMIHSQGRCGADLQIPTYFRVPHQAFLRLPWNEFDPSWEYVADVLRNIVGFLPLGIFLCGYLVLAQPRNKAILTTVLAGCALSLCIEILQAYLPQRVSGTTDILTNTLGTALGAFIGGSVKLRLLLTNWSLSKPTGTLAPSDPGPGRRKE